MTPLSGNLSDCVSVTIPPGDHLISAPLHFNNTSLQLIGSPAAVARCSYIPAVDMDGVLDADYSYVNYTLYFNQSEYFMVDGLEMFDCPFPVRLDGVQTVIIQDSIFG